MATAGKLTPDVIHQRLVVDLLVAPANSDLDPELVEAIVASAVYLALKDHPYVDQAKLEVTRK